MDADDAVGAGDEAVGAGGDVYDDFSGVLHGMRLEQFRNYNATGSVISSDF